MTDWLANYILTLVVSFILSGFIIPKIKTIAYEKKLFDDMDDRKVHRGAVPRLGGLSFLPSLVFAFCLVVGYSMLGSSSGMMAQKNSFVPLVLLMCSLMLMYLVGIADDLVGVRYRAKFMIQIFAGVLIASSGMWVRGGFGFLWIGEWPEWIGWIVTVFLSLYVMNAINLIDGIDGLASGLCIIALVFYSIVLLTGGEYMYALLAGAALGTLAMFFYHNVFGKAENHTKIFMGDTGSLTMGTVLLFLCVGVFGLKGGAFMGENLFIVALAPILLPCFDVARVFFHRVKAGRNPFMPDKSHIHHKLLALGYPQWRALIIILTADIFFIVLNLILSEYVGPTWLILGDVTVWTLANIFLTRAIRKRELKLGETLYR